MVQDCKLCPRCCGVDRTAGKFGFCRAGAAMRIYRYAPHFGEEPPVTGSRGSGTVFFSHCTMTCLYCQNFRWSQRNEGAEKSAAELAGIFRKLADAGCHNWNLVSPTPWLPQIKAALEIVRSEGYSLPPVYNTSGYERVETLKQYSGLADIYLTDLRYAAPSSAAAGSRAADYVDAARDALSYMWQRLGKLRCDENGVALSGVICRLLVLPGLASEAVASLEWLAGLTGAEISISLMSQYQPVYLAARQAPWNRRVTPEEYAGVCDAAARLGFENGWIQDYEEDSKGEQAGYEMAPGGFDTDIGGTCKNAV